jgi:hypothetical protein
MRVRVVMDSLLSNAVAKNAPTLPTLLTVGVLELCPDDRVITSDT